MIRQSLRKAQNQNEPASQTVTNLLQRKPNTRASFGASTSDVHKPLDLQSNNPGFQDAEIIFNQDFSQIPVRLNSPYPIQAKLKIGEPNDKYEQEADRVADQVMRMPDPYTSSKETGLLANNSPMSSNGTIQRACSTCADEYKAAEEEQRTVQSTNLCPKCRSGKNLIQTKPITPFLQRQKAPDEEEVEELIQAKADGVSTPAVTPAVSSGIQALQGGGRPLSRPERSFFEPRFGADFSGVRVHNDARATDLARSVNARAFTYRNNVVFNAGEYGSDSVAGKRLLGHELVHVVQQGGLSLFSEGFQRNIKNNTTLTPIILTPIIPSVQRQPKNSDSDESEDNKKKKPTFPFDGKIRTLEEYRKKGKRAKISKVEKIQICDNINYQGCIDVPAGTKIVVLKDAYKDSWYQIDCSSVDLPDEIKNKDKCFILQDLVEPLGEDECSKLGPYLNVPSPSSQRGSSVAGLMDFCWNSIKPGKDEKKLLDNKLKKFEVLSKKYKFAFTFLGNADSRENKSLAKKRALAVKQLVESKYKNISKRNKPIFKLAPRHIEKGKLRYVDIIIGWIRVTPSVKGAIKKARKALASEKQSYGKERIMCMLDKLKNKNIKDNYFVGWQYARDRGKLTQEEIDKLFNHSVRKDIVRIVDIADNKKQMISSLYNLDRNIEVERRKINELALTMGIATSGGVLQIKAILRALEGSKTHIYNCYREGN